MAKAEAMSWCLKRGYEFIELYPSDQNIQNTEEDIIPEKFGVNRVIEALQVISHNCIYYFMNMQYLGTYLV